MYVALSKLAGGCLKVCLKDRLSHPSSLAGKRGLKSKGLDRV